MHWNAKKSRVERKGVAIVELGISLPIFVLIALGTIEATSMIFLQQSLEISAYESARVALVPGSKVENVEACCQNMLEVRKVKSGTVEVQPADFMTQAYGTPITVRVTADCGANSLFSSWFYAGRKVTAEVTMMKEED